MSAAGTAQVVWLSRAWNIQLCRPCTPLPSAWRAGRSPGGGLGVIDASHQGGTHQEDSVRGTVVTGGGRSKGSQLSYGVTVADSSCPFPSHTSP